MSPIDGKHILVLENEHAISLEIASALDERLAVALIAFEAERAIAILNDRPVAAAIIDLTLGREQSRRLFECLIDRNIPFILHTALTSYEVGAAEVILKPALPETLMSALERAVARHQEQNPRRVVFDGKRRNPQHHQKLHQH